MSQSWILYPLYAMFLMTIGIGLHMLRLRFRAVRQDSLNPTYFKLNRGAKPPAYMLQAEQHFANLFETPLLFYVIILLVYILQMANPTMVVLAWCYVASRLIHAFIHLNENKIPIRRNVFLLSIFILFVLWNYVFILLSFRI